MEWIIAGSVVLIILLLLFLSFFNRLVRARHEVENARSQVDVQLQRRHDLIPNLVEVVRGYADHERDTLENVVRARNQAAGGTGGTEAEFAAENLLTRVLVDLRAVIEKYPSLKADRGFAQLQNQLGDTEEMIARTRQQYNDAVFRLHTLATQIPGSFIAPMARLGELPPYFRSAEEAQSAPHISFSEKV